MSVFVSGVDINADGDQVGATIRVTDPGNRYDAPSPSILPAGFRDALREWLDSE